MSNPETKELSQTEVSSQRALEQFDLADDAKVLKEFSKRVVKEFTYKVNGKFGLSSSGTNWAVREFAKQGEVIEVEGKPQIERCPFDQDYVNVTLKVQRFFVNPATGMRIPLDSAFGHKRMSRKYKRFLDEHDSTKFEWVEDPEFITKAVTKAERNGKQKLLPRDVIANLIAKATGQPTQGPAATGTKPPAKPASNAAPPNKPATPPAQGAPGTPPPGAAGTPPPAQQGQAASAPAKPANPPAGATPTQPAQPAKPADAAGKPKMTKEVMVQKLDAVSKLVFQTQDGAVARQKLAAITGKPSPADLSDEDIKSVGNAINAVAKKTAEIVGNDIVKIADKSVLWKGPAVAAAPPPPPEGTGEIAPDEEMF